MKLSANAHAYIAQRGQWYLDCAFSPRHSPMAFGDSVVFTGQGLADLNRTIGVVATTPPVHITCEVGTAGTIMLGNAFPKYERCDLEDLYAIKEHYIAFHGSLDKVDAYRQPPGAATEVR